MNLISRNWPSIFDFNDDTLWRDTNFMKADVYKHDGNCTIEMDIPGIKKEDIHMEIDHGYLTVSAKKEEHNEEKGEYIRQERFYGEMKRSFYVGDVDENSIKASFNNGILKVEFPIDASTNNKKQITID